MLDERDPVVAFKLDILRRGMPADDAIVFGDMYVVEGGYTAKCLEWGCERATLIDTFETPAWAELRLAHPTLDYYKGDFSDTLFMKSVTETFELGVAFDVLLHQPPLLSTIHLMLEKVRRSLVVVQPMLKEQALENTLVYLPGNRDTRLYPLSSAHPDFGLFDPEVVNQTRWIWGMTPSLLRSVLVGEGFEITHSESLRDLENDSWHWWGCVAERRRSGNPDHWSLHPKTRGLYLLPHTAASGEPPAGAREGAPPAGQAADAAGSAATGSSTTNVEPAPGSDSTLMRPPMR